MSSEVTLSSIVFVGSNFTASVFDERALFADVGELDSNQVKAGPIGQFSYAGGTYQFLVTPDRINLLCNLSEIIPEPLVSLAHKVVEVLKPVKAVMSVTGVGINCEANFEPDVIGCTGNKFCEAIAVNQMSKYIIGLDPSQVGTQFYLQDQNVRYSIRIEPRFDTGGRSLFVAVNGHQNVTEQDQLSDKLGAVSGVRDYAIALHQRIREWPNREQNLKGLLQ